MSGVQTGITITDGFSSALLKLESQLNAAVSSAQAVQNTLAQPWNVSGIESTAAAVNDAVNAMSGGWKSSNFGVIDGSGMERYTEEARSAVSMVNQLAQAQTRLAQQSFRGSFLPNDAVKDMTNMSLRMDNLQKKIQKMSSSKLHISTAEASSQIESLRLKMAEAENTQEELQAAMNSMDASAANAAYLKLDSQISSIEGSIRDNTNAQSQFNNVISQASNPANDLLTIIKQIGATYLSLKGITSILDTSDELVSTTARLNNMNDGLQSTQDLVNMVYSAAQDARGSFSGMADVVARFGNNAGDAFDSSAQVVEFADLVQKEMAIAGASTEEAANAELQLSQALGSGVLRGDELNSIFEQSPNLIQTIADYMDVPIGKIREMASDGELTADIVRDAVLSNADEINAQFDTMPMTWKQVCQSMQNTALMEFQPVLNKLNELANNQAFQTGMSNLMGLISKVAVFALSVIEQIGSAASWVSDNWSVIAPIVIGVATAFGVLAAAVGIYNLVQAIASGLSAVHSAALAMQSGATFSATAAQYGLNAAIAACPITWIVVAIIAAVAAIFAVCQAIANMTNIANTGFGVITGGINVVIQFFRNLGLVVADIAVGIWNAMSAVASNIVTAFHNSISKVQSFFYNLLATAASVISQIAAALNQLPFVEFDYSGITAAADNYAAKAAEAAGNTEEYTSISDAFSSGMGTFDAYQDGWASDAFASGSAWGDDKMAALDDMVSGLTEPSVSIPDIDSYLADMQASIPSDISSGIDGSGAGDAAKTTAGNTGKIADKMDATDEQLKYLRDIAERDVINRFTTASVNVDMSNMRNTVQNGMDIDGVISSLTVAVNDAVDNIAEGVHK